MLHKMTTGNESSLMLKGKKVSGVVAVQSMLTSVQTCGLGDKSLLMLSGQDWELSC